LHTVFDPSGLNGLKNETEADSRGLRFSQTATGSGGLLQAPSEGPRQSLAAKEFWAYKTPKSAFNGCKYHLVSLRKNAFITAV